MAKRDYTPEEKQEVIESICDAIEETSQSLRSVIKQEGMPSAKTFYQWLKEDESNQYAHMYACACNLRQENIFEDILSIADEANADITIGEDGQIKMNGDVVQRSRLKIDARKWVLGKMNPKVYGDASLLKLGDNEGNKIESAKISLDNLTTDQIQSLADISGIKGKD